MTEIKSKRDLETHLIEKAWKDPAFKQAVLANPKGMLEQYVGRALPAQMQVFVHEEDAHTLHFAIPPAPANVNELSDDELDRISGGTEVIVLAMIVPIAGLGLSMGVVAGKTAGGW